MEPSKMDSVLNHKTNKNSCRDSEEIFIDRLARILLKQIEIENNEQDQKIEQSEN